MTSPKPVTTAAAVPPVVRYLDPTLPIYEGCTVIPEIQGANYFPALQNAIRLSAGGDVKKQFLYFTGWWLDPDFSLDGGIPFLEYLVTLATAGVDVRVLGWVMAPEMLQNKRVLESGVVDDILGLNKQTMQFIDTLQKSGTSLANTACLNTLSHPAAAVHMKMAIVGSDTQTFGFTGGMDLVADRFKDTWHDVAAMVTGPAVQNFIEAFGKMWTEIKGRSPISLSLPELGGTPGVTCMSHTDAMPPFTPPTVVNTSAHHFRVQSVRTLPQFHFASAPVLFWITMNSLPKNDPLKYALSGLTEVKQVWQKAIGDAYLYIYMEDQAFWSTTICDWLNAMIKSSATLRVVLLKGRADPNDKPNQLGEKVFRIAANHLVDGLSGSQLARVGLFSHQEKTVHTKSTIIDDQWSIIGSANSMRRSLYSDFEHSVSFMDNDNLAVPAYRKDLWSRHIGAGDEITAALDAWFAVPFIDAAPAAKIVRLHLPFAAVTLSKEEQTTYDEAMDFDSRQPWGSGGLYDILRGKIPGWANALIIGVCAVVLGAVGAIVGALVGGPVGAAVGGVAGALVGAALGSML